jgi:hypothetical protein
MKKVKDQNLTPQQKEAIAEQLADFFFDFWTNRQNKSDNKKINRNGQAVASGSGLLRNFPENPKATT